MKRNQFILLSCILFSAFSGHSQALKTSRDNFWAIKGKILPWFGILSGQSGINSLIGVEYGIKRSHSLGLDVYFNRWHLWEDRYDPVKNEYVAEYAIRYRTKDLFLNYRYYFMDFKNAPKVVPYFGAFVSPGYFHEFYDEGYVTNVKDYKEIHYSAGTLIGIRLAPDPKRLGGDINLGFFYRRKDIEEVTEENSVNVTSGGTAYNFGMRIGLNLYLWFER